MTQPPRKLNLLQIVKLAKSFDWCTWYHCTTCGAHQFRASVRKNLNRDMLIEQLRGLDVNFVDNSNNRGIMLILLSDTASNNYWELSQELENTPAGEFLIRAIRVEKDRIQRHKASLESQSQRKSEREKMRAEKNIWGAIKRRDYAAVESLLTKKPDKSLTNRKNQSLQSVLDQMIVNTKRA